MAESVTLNGNTLEFHRKSGDERLRTDAVMQIDRCHLAERAMQGDEEFHILHSVDTFWLIGPFVNGGLKAIGDFLAKHPDTPVRDAAVNQVPWAFRKPGWFGLRLYPTPGFVKMPMNRLHELRLTTEE